MDNSDQDPDRDRYLSSFYWLLLIEILLAVGYPLFDFLSLIFYQKASSLRDFMSRSLGYSLVGTLIVGTVVSGMAFYRLKHIHARLNPRGRRITLFGLHLTGSLILMLALLWALVLVW